MSKVYSLELLCIKSLCQKGVSYVIKPLALPSGGPLPGSGAAASLLRWGVVSVNSDARPRATDTLRGARAVAVDTSLSREQLALGEAQITARLIFGILRRVHIYRGFLRLRPETTH